MKMTANGSASIFLTLLMMTPLVGCRGDIGEEMANPGGDQGTTTGGMPSEPGKKLDGTPSNVMCAANAGRSPLRRLNRDEYRNTLHDLFPKATFASVDAMIDPTIDTFPLDEEKLGFTNNADALTVTGILAGDYITTAETLATEATTAANLPNTLSMCAAPKTGDACAQAFIADFGRRAFRRPLTADETTHYTAVYSEGNKDGFDQGISLAMEAFLESPYFLYRPEKGTPTTISATAKLTSYEVASRLSYFLWASMPDSKLLDAAAMSQLDTADQVEQQARRMMSDPRAKAAVSTFHEEWFELRTIGDKMKDAMLFPQYTPTITSALFTETANFAENAFWNEGTSEKLFTAPYTFLSTALATYYGITPPTGAGFVKTMVDTTQRSGILTQGSLMTIFSYENQTSPIHRGKFVREQLLCQQLTPPPPDIAAKVKPPIIMPGTPTRERFAQHEADPVCGACHKAMDPIGLSFENFDPVGRWRTMDQGKPISNAGEIFGSDDVDGKFNGPVELGAKLAQSAEVRACIVTQWFRYANGRAEAQLDDANPTAPNDDCTLQGLKADFEAGHDMREIPIKIAVSDAFRFRSTAGGGQ
jgi:hypothetical protein